MQTSSLSRVVVILAGTLLLVVVSIGATSDMPSEEPTNSARSPAPHLPVPSATPPPQNDLRLPLGPAPAAATPEDAMRAVFHHPPTAYYPRLHPTFLWQRTAVALVTTCHVDENGVSSSETLRYFLLVPADLGWKLTLENGGFGGVPEVGTGIAYSVEQHDTYTIVFGWVLSSDIAVVDVAVGDGRTVAHAPDDGVFAVLVPREQEPREVRTLDRQGRVLQTFDVVAHPQNSVTGKPCRR